MRWDLQEKWLDRVLFMDGGVITQEARTPNRYLTIRKKTGRRIFGKVL